MKAIIKPTRAPGLTLADVEKPKCAAGEVLIKTKKTAICGTDLHIYEWDAWSQGRMNPPTIVGHEFMGVVEEVGSLVKGINVGDRVSGEGHITCGFCRNCRAGTRHLCRNTEGIGYDRNGCFAEYLTLPFENAFKIPDNITDNQASIFDPFGNAVHTTLAFDLVGEDVLITGAGPIGCMAAAIARHVGARYVVVCDVNPYRLELAKKMGAHRAIDLSKTSLKEVMKDLGMKEGFDVGLEISGNGQAFSAMIEHMNFGGKIALLGTINQATVDWSKVIFHSLTLKGIYGRQMYETWYKMTSMLQSGLDISTVITHELPYTEIEAAIDLIKKGQCGKIILNW